jgi:hypothetical protein
MSIGAVSGLGGSSFAPPDRASAVTPLAAVTASSGAPPASQTIQTGTIQAAGAPATSGPATKTPQPFLLVPTEPLTPTVLAELIGRQAPLSGS